MKLFGRPFSPAIVRDAPAVRVFASRPRLPVDDCMPIARGLFALVEYVASSVSSPVTSPTSGEVSLTTLVSPLSGLSTVMAALSVLPAPVTFAATMG